MDRLRLSCDTLRAAGDITGEVSLKTVGGIALSFADADDAATMQEDCRTSYAG